MPLQDAVYGEGNDDDMKVKTAASRKRKTAEEEQDIKEQAAGIDFKVTVLCCYAAACHHSSAVAGALHVSLCVNHIVGL